MRYFAVHFREARVFVRPLKSRNLTRNMMLWISVSPAPVKLMRYFTVAFFPPPKPAPRSGDTKNENGVIKGADHFVSKWLKRTSYWLHNSAPRNKIFPRPVPRRETLPQKAGDNK
jgi:hypothetical protein